MGARRFERSGFAEVSMLWIRHWKTSSNSAICSSEKSTAPLMKRSVTRRRVSTRRATVPCASVLCNSSSRCPGWVAVFELMTLSWRKKPVVDSPPPKLKYTGSGAGDAVASLCLGCVKRAVGAREERVRGLLRLQRRDAGGNRHLHVGRKCAPVEFGNNRAQPVERARCIAGAHVGQH